MTLIQAWHCEQVHRMSRTKLCKNLAFAVKFKDVAAPWLDAPIHAVVLSLGEKSQVQALDRQRLGRSQPWSPALRLARSPR